MGERSRDDRYAFDCTGDCRADCHGLCSGWPGTDSAALEGPGCTLLELTAIAAAGHDTGAVRLAGQCHYPVRAGETEDGRRSRGRRAAAKTRPLRPGCPAGTRRI